MGIWENVSSGNHVFHLFLFWADEIKSVKKSEGKIEGGEIRLCGCFRYIFSRVGLVRNIMCQKGEGIISDSVLRFGWDSFVF